MYLDDLLELQKKGFHKGIFSVCSAHPYVLKQTLLTCAEYQIPPLIEATCNQVNQFGGYTGMKPADFIRFVRGIADENHFSFNQVILGGDHLGPSVWQHEPEDAAMPKAEQLIHDYVEAGFTKIHLDCSMRLGDDPEGPLDTEISAIRAARLAGVAEGVGAENIRYVIGTEVPVPGGATEHEEGVQVTRVEDVRQTIEVTRDAFYRQGLHATWERVIAVVVQPGVEFGDDFVLPYRPALASGLSRFIEGFPFVYEAHSTDYQSRSALENLVQDHFAILKVGPALTFAFREAVFALAMMENELVPSAERSNIVAVMDKVMIDQNEYWFKYYQGSEQEKAFKRKFSLSDRIRYYWSQPAVQSSFAKMMGNLNEKQMPLSLLKQFVPDVYNINMENPADSPEKILLARIQLVLDDYCVACNVK